MQADLWRCVCGCVNRDQDHCEWCRRYRPDAMRGRGARVPYALALIVATLLFVGLLATAGQIGR